LCTDVIGYFRFTIRGDLLNARMYRKSFLLRSETEVKIPHANNIALDLAEPQIKPLRVGRSEVQAKLRGAPPRSPWPALLL